MAELSTNVRYIKGIGETRAKALEKLGITTLGRGGSDTSAVAIAAALHAVFCA